MLAAINQSHLLIKRKSIAFYMICFCLGLIVLSSLFALIWQPGFEQGVIFITIMDSDVGYNLWGFLAAVFLLIAFIFLCLRVLRSSGRNTSALLLASLIGFAFAILLDHITYGWTSRPSIVPAGRPHLTPEKYNLILLVIKIFIGIAIMFLLYRWVKLKSTAANT